MLKWLCFSIMDKKVGSYDRPFFAKHVIDVSRSLEQALLKGEGQFAQYPADFALYMVGEFDTESGHFIPAAVPVHMFEVAALVKGGQNG